MLERTKADRWSSCLELFGRIASVVDFLSGMNEMMPRPFGKIGLVPRPFGRFGMVPHRMVETAGTMPVPCCHYLVAGSQALAVVGLLRRWCL